MDYDAMRDKHDYMQRFGVDNEADILRTLAMFGGFTEGLQLFASFADPAQLSAAQQDARHGADRLVVGARREAALRR